MSPPVAGGVQQEEKVKKLLRNAKEGKCYDVLETYKKERELRTEKITDKEDTVLHMALSKRKDVFWASEMVSTLLEEEKNVKDKVEENGLRHGVKEVLGAKNKTGNTALHLAASMGHVGLCDMIGKADHSLLTERNIDGETPLFLAAQNGNKQAFLRLHYLHMDNNPTVSPIDYRAICKRDNDDTIVHCAIAQGHIDVAIEIFHPYRDLVEDMQRNKDGLSPLHLLAAEPSAFKSTSLHGRFITVHLFYRLFSVTKKERATTKQEVTCEQITFEDICLRVLDVLDSVSLPDIPGVQYILALMVFITLVLLSLPISILFLFLLAGRWLHEIRKMKEEHEWYRQIMHGLVESASYDEMSKIISYDLPSASSETKKDNESGCIIVETPLMIAAKNGVVEMVEKILEKYRLMVNNVNDEGKNIVLLAAEHRQTKVYKFLWDCKESIPESAVRQMDENGNTALHLAARLGVNLNWQAITMVEEVKWFKFVKKSVPSDLWERYNQNGETAEDIFRDRYKELMKSDREWLNQTSQACSLVSTLVASMAFTNVAAGNSNDKDKPILRNKFGFKAFPNPYLVALSLSLVSTISFLGILASRFQSVSYWKYVPFMLHIGMSFMFSSIFTLWISLMLHDDSPTTYAILGSPIALLIIVSLPIFIGPTLMSMFTKVPAPNRRTTSAIRYRRTKKMEHGTYLKLRGIGIDGNKKRKRAIFEES